MTKLISFRDNNLPKYLNRQILKLFKLFFPDDFQRKNHNAGLLKKNRQIEIGFLIIDGNQLISHAAILNKELRHSGINYKLAGLGGVVTDKRYWGKGHGTKIVKAATDYIKTKDYDIAVLFCGKSRQNFYRRNGWLPLNNANINQGENLKAAHPLKTGEIAMVLYLSGKATENKKSLENQPIFFGEPW